jgi:hypothetical protein
MLHKGEFHQSHSKSNTPEVASVRKRRTFALARAAFALHAWKADFNQCDGRQLIGALQRAEKHAEAMKSQEVPFVLIGHSKLFTKSNESALKPFLTYLQRHTDRFRFSTLQSVSPYQSNWAVS